MFVQLYGPRAPAELTAYIGKLEKQYDVLEQTHLSEALRAAYRKRCAEAMREPGAGGRWVIPDPILDEGAFKKSVLEAERSNVDCKS